MTNEERLEERLHHAFERGYYHKVLQRVEELKTQFPKMSHHDRFDTACTESKQEWLQINKDND
jgi:hypothetical protein